MLDDTSVTRYISKGRLLLRGLVDQAIGTCRCVEMLFRFYKR
jgi:hypothetical protein